MADSVEKTAVIRQCHHRFIKIQMVYGDKFEPQFTTQVGQMWELMKGADETGDACTKFVGALENVCRNRWGGSVP